MIVIHAGRCDGCGTCIEVCPEGAIYLVDGKAAVDGSLCWLIMRSTVLTASCPRDG